MSVADVVDVISIYFSLTYFSLLTLWRGTYLFSFKHFISKWLHLYLSNSYWSNSSFVIFLFFYLYLGCEITQGIYAALTDSFMSQFLFGAQSVPLSDMRNKNRIDLLREWVWIKYLHVDVLLWVSVFEMFVSLFMLQR